MLGQLQREYVNVGSRARTKSAIRTILNSLWDYVEQKLTGFFVKAFFINISSYYSSTKVVQNSDPECFKNCPH